MGDQITNIFGTILSWIPEILKTLLVLLIGYFVAIAIKAIVVKVFERIKLNKRISDLPRAEWLKKAVNNPAAFIGNFVYWLIWIIVITIAIPILNIPFLNQLIYDFYRYLPNVITSIIILFVAILISAGIDMIISKIMGDTPTGKIVMTIAPSLIMTIAVFMILVQLGIATPIVIITYAAILGSLALGFALAFGLGGREMAAKILNDTYQKGTAYAQDIKRDTEKGRERAKKEYEKYKEDKRG